MDEMCILHVAGTLYLKVYYSFTFTIYKDTGFTHKMLVYRPIQSKVNKNSTGVVWPVA